MNAEIDISGVRIETDRLLLRPWQMSDLDDLYEYASIPGVGEMAGWQHHTSMDNSKEILNMFICGKKVFALVLKDEGKVIGSLGIEKLDSDPVGEGKLGREIGYVLSRAHWGRGLMPEAVMAVIDYCFSVLKLDYLTCGHFERNSQSRRVIEKCGFTRFGTSKFKTQMGTEEPSCNYIIHNPQK